MTPDEMAERIAQDRALAELVRAGDAGALTKAYRQTFSGAVGRLVLLHFISECGVGALQEVGRKGSDRHYWAGRHDAAIGMLNMAGFDQVSAALAVMNEDFTEENQDETSQDGLADFEPDDY